MNAKSVSREKERNDHKLLLYGIDPIHQSRAHGRNGSRERDGVPVAAVVKRLLQEALAAEGELELTPTRIFQRIDTGYIDDVS